MTTSTRFDCKFSGKYLEKISPIRLISCDFGQNSDKTTDTVNAGKDASNKPNKGSQNA